MESLDLSAVSEDWGGGQGKPRKLLTTEFKIVVGKILESSEIQEMQAFVLTGAN